MNVRIHPEQEKETDKKKSKSKADQKAAEQKGKSKKPKKPKKEKRVRTPREATALMLGMVSLLLAVAGVAALLWVSSLAAAILGGCAVLGGFSSLMVGKGGTLPAVIAIGAGFLTVLCVIVEFRLGQG